MKCILFKYFILPENYSQKERRSRDKIEIGADIFYISHGMDSTKIQVQNWMTIISPQCDCSGAVFLTFPM